MHKDLLYCLKYADNFPTDRKTALTFISCRMAQNARPIYVGFRIILV